MANGSTLIEVLVSLVLLSIILFGFDAVQIHIQRQTKVIYLYAIASQQISNIVYRLYSLEGNQLSQEIERWNQQNRAVLPDGRGVVSQGMVSIFWGKNASTICQENKIDQNGCLRRKLS